ncbi:MAG: type II toxin-antitoxin system prevent-host-death family antitoxin [Acidobacteriota bacterium]
MSVFVTKSQFKLKASEYLRQVESSGEEMIITHRGRPVIKMVPFVEKGPRQILKDLRGSVLFYKDPTEPVGLQDWEALRSHAKPQSRKESAK